MNFLKIAEKIGAGIIANAVPGGSAIITTINSLLPSDKQLPATTTGDEARSVLSTLTSEQKSVIITKEFDVDLAQYDTLKTMLMSDATNPQSSRPFIAKGAFFVLSFVIVVTVSLWAYGVLIRDQKLVSVVMQGWPFVLSVVAPITSLLLGYFGILKTEHKNKMNAVTGKLSASLLDLIKK